MTERLSTQDAFWHSQSRTPLLNTLQDLAQRTDAAFYAPGHKRGQGIPEPLANLLGKAVFRSDLPELPELDNLFTPEGAIAEAQSLAAEAFGAEKTWFLINGSTCGIIAAILATCSPGDKIILPRNLHQSAIAGLILSGAVPIFLKPEYDANWDVAYSFTPEALAIALQQHPDAKAVLAVYPTYHGICGDIRGIADIAHRYGIPLLVDEAHGAHFAFHPDLPLPALAAGADLTVQSTHKVLAAMTQASMLHLQGNRLDSYRLNQALQLVESTSPSYLLLASLDAARQQMALWGQQLLAKTLELAAIARSQISGIPGLSVLDIKSPVSGFQELDRTRLTVGVSQLGITGFAADAILHEQLGVTAELPMLRHLTFIISFGNTEADINKLVRSLTTLADRANENKQAIADFSGFQPLEFITHYSPREAFFAPTETVAIENSIGRISAETICPYPPGIPVLLLGEIITGESLRYLQQILAAGGTIAGCSDTTLKAVKVILSS
jgi:arginine/lysine/ornithine decarboxylase